MTILTIVLLFLSLLGFSFYFNTKQRDFQKVDLILLSFVEAIICFTFLLLFTLIGFVYHPLYLFVLFFIVTLLGVARFIKEKSSDNNGEIIMETIKNTLILFHITVLPFVVSLTALRYIPFYLQIPLSIAITIGVFFASFPLQTATSVSWKKISIKLDFTGGKGPGFIFIVIILSIGAVLAFNFPNDPVNNLFNLNNHRPVFVPNKGYEIDIQGNYESVLIDEMKLPETTPLPYDDIIEFPSPTVLEDFTEIKYFEDTENNLSYSIKSEDFKTIYTKTDAAGNETVYELRNMHNSNAIFIDGTVYLVFRASELIEIMDEETFEITSIYNIQPKSAFYEGNEPTDYKVYYRIVDNKLHYIQTDFADGYVYIKEYELVKQDVDMELPFYTHYRMMHIVLILAFMLMPITNVQSTTTYIDFKSRYSKKEQ